MKVLHIVNMSSKISGISEVIKQQIIIENQINTLTSSLLITGDFDGELEIEMDYFRSKDLSVVEVLNIVKPNVVILHSLYHPEFLKISNILIQKKIPYYIKPHGGLSKIGQRKGFLKKFIANVLFFNNFIKNSTGIIYLNEGELKNSFWKGSNKTFILPNGIVPPNNLPISNINEEKIKLLFLGRIDFLYKGIYELLSSIELIKEDLDREFVEINFYGTGEEKQVDRLKKEIKKKGLENIIRFRGPVFGEEKSEIFSTHDIFLLTSRSEGMPMAVMEALTFGLPCFLTDGTNMSCEVASNNAGWRTELDYKSLAVNLLNAIKQYKDNKPLYRENASELSENYHWQKVKLQLESFYDQLIQ